MFHITSTLYNFATNLLTLVDCQIGKKLNRERFIDHTVWLSHSNS